MANDTIGSMTAVIRATAAQFSNDMKQAESSIREFSTKATENFAAASHSADSFHEHLNAIGEGLGIGAGIELMRTGIEKAAEQFHKFFEVIESGAQLEATAKRIGTTAASLSELQYAAERMEVSAETLRTGLEKMEKTIGEVHAGNKEAAETFNELGLSISQIENLSADQQFLKFADAIRALKNPADEAAEAVKIFGKTGADMLPIIDQGSAAIEKMMKSGRELGRTLSDEDARAFELATQSIKDLTEDLTALTRHLAVEFVPLIRAAAKMLDEFVKSLDKQRTTIVDSVLKWGEWVAEILAVVTIAPAIISAIGGIIEAIEAFTAAETIAESLNPAGLAAVVVGLAASAVAVAEIHSKFNDVKSGIAGAVEEAKKLAKSAEAEVEVTKQATKAREQALAVYEEQKKAAEELVKLQERLQKSGEEMTKSLRTPMEKYVDSIKDAKALLDAATISADTFARASAKAAKELLASIPRQKNITFGALAEGTSAAYVQAQKNDFDSQQDKIQADMLAQLIDANKALGVIAQAVGAGWRWRAPRHHVSGGELLMRFDPLHPSQQHTNFVINASRLVDSAIGRIKSAHAAAIESGMAEPVIMVFDLGNRQAANLAREVAGKQVAEQLDQRDGGSRPDAVSLTIVARPFDWIHAWLVANGLPEAARQMERPKDISNIKAMVFASDEIAWLNAERFGMG